MLCSLIWFWQRLFMESVIFGGFVYHFHRIGIDQIDPDGVLGL
jgi:hypothetical protein